MNIQTIATVLYALLARAEIEATLASGSSFIPAASPAAALAAVARVFASAATSILIVDLYASAILLLDFCVTAGDNVQIEILTSSRGSKPDLKPAYVRWRQQFGTKRPLEIRSVSDGSVHDRIIIVDRDKLFIVGQSFNALATKSPTYIAELNPEIRSMKMRAYLGAWASASPI